MVVVVCIDLINIWTVLLEVNSGQRSIILFYLNMRTFLSVSLLLKLQKTEVRNTEYTFKNIILFIIIIISLLNLLVFVKWITALRVELLINMNTIQNKWRYCACSQNQLWRRRGFSDVPGNVFHACPLCSVSFTVSFYFSDFLCFSVFSSRAQTAGCLQTDRKQLLLAWS